MKPLDGLSIHDGHKSSMEIVTVFQESAIHRDPFNPEAINPANGARLPLFVADYVLMGYGKGAIMAVPGHDSRDHAFARAFDLPIVRVVTGGGDLHDEAFEGDGTMVNSPPLDGLSAAAAKTAAIAWLEARGAGRAKVQYHLRDWLFSRQRYWGEPFPIAWVSEADYRLAAAIRADLPASPVTFKENGVVHFALPLRQLRGGGANQHQIQPRPVVGPRSSHALSLVED